MFELSHNAERRQFERVRYAEPVGIHFVRPDKFGGCLSADLSEGGLRLKVTDYIAPGTELAVKIELDSFKVIELTGTVAWAEKDRFNERYQIGLKFEEQDSRALVREKIHRFIETH